MVKMVGGNVCIDESEWVNESDLPDDHVIGLVVKFMCFWKEQDLQCESMAKFHSPDEESVVLLMLWFRKGCVCRHIGEAVLIARPGSHAIFP
jgi:hypothetical protein